MLIIWLLLSSFRLIHDAAEMLCDENKISWTVCMSVLLTNTAECFSGSFNRYVSYSATCKVWKYAFSESELKQKCPCPRHAGVGRGGGSKAPFILNLGTRWGWYVCYTPRAAALAGWNDCDPLNRRLGGPQSRSGRLGEGINILPLPGIEPWFLGYPSRSLVNIPVDPRRQTDDSCNWGLIKELILLSFWEVLAAGLFSSVPPNECLKLGHGRFFAHVFQLIIPNRVTIRRCI